ncbi:MAG: sugar ABC transporter permease, partial [Mesorhizobium sp.]
MTDTTSDTPANPPADRARASELSTVGRFLKATELDTRMLGMVGALLIIWIGLHVISSLRLGVNPLDFDSRTFLTPRNLWNLSVQTSAVAIMASGMVLVIVMRNIDLSVGSAEGLIGMVMGFAQVHFLVRMVGLELGNPWIWVLALLIGLALGLLIGAFQGFVIAYLEVPAFIVTLGGLLVWRGAAWWVTRQH